ncbi:MAG: Fe-S cluster assembly protein SufD [Snowella sp.]|nr:Fe-S cluster assembly protein SufD [Snowella sp.]
MTLAAVLENKSVESLEETSVGRFLQQSQRKTSVIEAAFLTELRQNAATVLGESRVPNKRDEEWQFTDLSDLLKIDFQTAVETPLEPAILNQFVLEEAQQSRLVFTNGIYSPDLSDVSALPEGVFVGNLQQLAEAEREKLAQYLGKQEGSDEFFTALNISGLTDVAIVWVKANVVVSHPLHLLFLSVVSGTPSLIQPRVLVIAEAHSSVSLVESYGAISEKCTDWPQHKPYFTNAVTEIYLAENAQVTHLRNQRESGDSFHIAKTAIAQAQNSRYTIYDFNLGAKLCRHNLEIFQQGEQTETNLNGLTIIAGRQVSDTHSAIHLRYPHGTTNQLHKCIVDEYSHAVFNGKVFVPKAAQMTNANQLNRNLVLSSKARVNTKPELQITADNVKCSHGATVSQLEADEIFYLQSRGLNDYDARHLLLDAFAGEILDQISVTSLQQRLRQCISCRTI